MYIKPRLLFAALFVFVISCAPKAQFNTGLSSTSEYLRPIKDELVKEWPKNRTINLVFHGHSVPAGYFKTPVVNTVDAYPYQVLRLLKEKYPLAVINVINTAIGGEHSESGQKRFESEVLRYKPDVLFIDYALNDRGLGLEVARTAWEKMIVRAQKPGIKIILLTPSPDLGIDIMESDNILEQHAKQIRELAHKYGVGLVDSYSGFHEIKAAGGDLGDYMSQVNHPNKKGHELIARETLKYFID